MKDRQHIPKPKGTHMLNQNSKSLYSLPRLTVKPLQMLLNFDQKYRERVSLRNLDARTMQDIGMSEARREQELRHLKY
jgi:uncharacterized protein YjiS (DUF1127 family)